MHLGDVLEPLIGVWGVVWRRVGLSGKRRGDVFAYLLGFLKYFLVFLRSRGVLDAIWRHLGSVVKAFWRRPGASTECFPDLGGDITVSGHF